MLTESIDSPGSAVTKQLMYSYFLKTKKAFKNTLKYLKQWACCRSFGLGTRIPCDEDFLVELLSDSTIYMAYYRFCHLSQNGEIFCADTYSVKH